MELTVTTVEQRSDKNGKAYKNIGLSTPTKVNGITLQPKTSSMNAYEENYLGNQDFGWDLKEGDKIIGEFVTREVDAYQIDGKTVSHATVLALPLAGQMEVSELAIKRAFANRGFILASAEEEVAAPANEVEA